jgi:hypothetical protein
LSHPRNFYSQIPSVTDGSANQQKQVPSALSSNTQRYSITRNDESGAFTISIRAFVNSSVNPFDIEIETQTRTLHICEKNEHSVGQCAFHKAWRLPTSIQMDEIKTSWTEKSNILDITMPAVSRRVSVAPAREVQSQSDGMGGEPSNSITPPDSSATVAIESKKHPSNNNSGNPVLPVCAVGMKVWAYYAPTGNFYKAVIQALDMHQNNGEVTVSWNNDGDTRFVKFPVRQEFLQGCQLPLKIDKADIGTSIPASESHQSTTKAKDELKKTYHKISTNYPKIDTPVGETIVLVDKNENQNSDNEVIEITDQCSDDEVIEITEDWLTEDDFAAQVKDDDAASGYFLFGEFHHY